MTVKKNFRASRDIYKSALRASTHCLRQCTYPILPYQNENCFRRPWNNALRSFEQSIGGPSDTPHVAKDMLVFMVRGLFIKLHFPYAQYPTRGVTADYLFPIAWEVVKNLELAGFKVLSLTGDKASPNRKFFRMHRRGTTQKSGITYKIRNPYSIEERDIYFISDVPHLIKTVRNCWSNIPSVTTTREPYGYVIHEGLSGKILMG